ncbi:hypothetical protein ACOME3_007596 [Neoechinorhynchus agilis]
MSTSSPTSTTTLPVPSTELPSTTPPGVPELFDCPDLDQVFIDRVNDQIRQNRLYSSDFDEANVKALLQLTPQARMSMIEEYESLRNTTWIPDRAAYISNLIQKHNGEQCCCVEQSNLPKQDEPLAETTTSSSLAPVVATGNVPDSEVMKSIVERTKYPYEVTSTQRRYGPAPDADVSDRTELYVGRLPKTLSEDRLIPLFEEFGKLWDLRYLVNPYDGLGRGFCFVNYCRKEDAQRAIDRLDGYEVVPGTRISVSKSDTQNVLYVRGIPRSKRGEDVRTELSRCVDGIIRVDVTPGKDTPNRGFCFVHFESQRTAAIAKKKITGGRYRFFDRDLLADWSESQVDPAAASRVKALFVAKLGSDASEEDLKEVFVPYGSIERVKKFDTYGFVHFVNREDAEKALEAFRSGKFQAVKGKNVDVEFAKPLADVPKRKPREQGSRGGSAQPSGQPPFPIPFMMENSAFFGHSSPNHPMPPSPYDHHMMRQSMPLGPPPYATGGYPMLPPLPPPPPPPMDTYGPPSNKRRYRSNPHLGGGSMGAPPMPPPPPQDHHYGHHQHYQHSPFQSLYSTPPPQWRPQGPKRYRSANNRNGGGGGGRSSFGGRRGAW